MKTKQSELTDVVSAGPRERIHANASKLSRQQRLIADYVLDHLKDIPFLAVPELAERTKTSDATVVRFCQRIGYRGYSEFKMDLVDALRDDMRSMQGGTPSVPDIGRDSLSAMARLEQHNIERTLENIDSREFREVAAAIFHADYVHTFGLGISACLAEFASYLFTEHGLRSVCLPTHFSSPREQLVALRPTDLVVCFSFPPYSKQTIEMLAELKARGIPSLVLTDRITSPAAALAKHTLAVSSHGMTFTNATASAHVVLNALVLEISARFRDETVDAISKINDILREQSDLIDEEHETC